MAENRDEHSITVGQLIEALSRIPDKDRLVVLAKGDDFTPLANVWSDDCEYLAGTTWSGECYESHELEVKGSTPAIALSGRC